MSYFCRFTPHSDTDYSLDKLSEFISQLSNKYVISYEQKPRNNHYHICLWDVNRSPENLRYHFRTNLVGKVYISGKEIEDQVKAIAYTIKDGSYKSHGIDVFTWMAALRTTKKKESFDEDLTELTDRYSPNLYDDKWLCGGILELYKKFNRKVYTQHIRALMTTIKLKKDPHYRDKLVDKILCYD